MLAQYQSNLNIKNKLLFLQKVLQGLFQPYTVKQLQHPMLFVTVTLKSCCSQLNMVPF